MKAAITIVVILGVFLGVYKIWEYYDQVEQQKEARKAEVTEVSPTSIPGLPYQLEPKAMEAQQQGAKYFKAWLEQNRSLIQDPRLAWLELDLVLLLSKSDPIEAKRLYAAVRRRAEASIEATSPVHKRLKDLARTYE